MTSIISGKEISSTIREEIHGEVQQLHSEGLFPCLAVILVGQDPASEIYVRNKQKACEQLGIRSQEYKLDKATPQEDLEALVQQLNNDPEVHGILCQFPLPQHLNEERIILSIDPKKDVDGLHPLNVGYLCIGKPQFIPCTPSGVLQMLKRSQIATSGQQVIILGRSQLVSRPLSNLLSQKGYDATVTLCHSRTQDLPQFTQQADILIAAIGQPEFVTSDMVKEGAVIIDVGINRVDDPTLPKGYRVCGDVHYESVAPKASAITPVPGGVGPMTITMLLHNTLHAAKGTRH